MHEHTAETERSAELEVATFMKQLAASAPLVSSALTQADARILWVKARLVRQWETERRSQAIQSWAEPFEYAAAAVGVYLLLAWARPPLQQILSLIPDLQ